MSDNAAILPVALWLRGESVGLRAVDPADAAVAGAWYDSGPSLSRDEAAALLVSSERVPWGRNPVVRLMVVRLETGEVAGSVVIRRTQERIGRLEIALNGLERRERGRMEGEVLGLVVKWALGEMGLMSVTISMPDDALSLIGAARSAGMREAVRLRQAIVRPAGRVDLLTFERVNREWGRPWREGANART